MKAYALYNPATGAVRGFMLFSDAKSAALNQIPDAALLEISPDDPAIFARGRSYVVSNGKLQEAS